MSEAARRVGTVLIFHEDDPPRRYSMPDPNSEALDESMHRLRYEFHSATQDDAYRVLAAAGAYLHFAAHPSPTCRLVKQLRELRSAVRELQEASDGD